MSPLFFCAWSTQGEGAVRSVGAGVAGSAATAGRGPVGGGDVAAGPVGAAEPTLRQSRVQICGRTVAWPVHVSECAGGRRPTAPVYLPADLTESVNGRLAAAERIEATLGQIAGGQHRIADLARACLRNGRCQCVRLPGRVAGWQGGRVAGGGRRCACWRQRTEPAGNAQTRILFGDGSTYDTRQQQARALYWQQTERGYFRYGVDSWWADCTEPFCSGRLRSRVCRRRIVNMTAEKSGD